MITGCPQAITYMAPIGSTQIEVTWTEPTATDNSGFPTTRIRSHQPSDTFRLGTTQVLYTFSDQAGNSAQCLFDVTVGKCKLKGVTESGPTCRYPILGEG